MDQDPPLPPKYTTSDESMSNDDSLSVSSTGSHDSQGQDSELVPLAQNETRAVNRSKIFVYVALVAAAIIVGALTYAFANRAEQIAFENDFEATSREVIKSSESNSNNLLGFLRTLKLSIVSYSLDQEWDWPLGTFPNFDTIVYQISNMSAVELVAYCPIVNKTDRAKWEEYSVTHQDYIQRELDVRGWEPLSNASISRTIFPFKNVSITPGEHAMHAPVWQVGPVVRDNSVINLDLYSHPTFRRMMDDVQEVKHKLLSEVMDLSFLLEPAGLNETDGQPRTFILVPVYHDLREIDVMGFLVAIVPWESYFQNVLPDDTNGIVVDVKDTCGSEFTYVINGGNAEFMGQGDLHDVRYDRLQQASDFALRARYDGDLSAEGHCLYSIYVYPSAEYEATFYSRQPVDLAILVIMVFLVTTFVFVIYDVAVQRRQKKVLSQATSATEIVASLFPKSIQEQLLQEAARQAHLEQRKHSQKFGLLTPRSQMQGLLDDGLPGSADSNDLGSKPIAELFPEVTIMFADIVGFTAWSSTREPSQVFTLLETLYNSFDQIARRRRVFKVETVGDCYVAVAGLPDPRKDHAQVMARFARDCIARMRQLLKELEVALGPETTELGMRVGLHSGAVTAGVLRGEKSRFQLFGDAMNTTARIEATGSKNKIHISHETADLLTNVGKGHWVAPREGKVFAKGKGELDTYWLVVKSDSRTLRTSSSSSDSIADSDDHVDAEVGSETDGAAMVLLENVPDFSSKEKRLIKWNAEMLENMLRQIRALRLQTGVQPVPESKMRQLELATTSSEGTIVLDLVEEVIPLPNFNEQFTVAPQLRAAPVPAVVSEQLLTYVTTIAAMYRRNPFHNFEHASHVTMSVVKLLGRIIAPEIKHSKHVAKDLHDHTYGITSDPLTQFACILSALIHDVDHTGVPNSQLIREQSSIAAVYKNKSVAEQNSFDIAWDLLMTNDYTDLRRAIYATETEFKRFRQLVINAVMATDIMDKELGYQRKQRWNKAFAEGSTHGLLEQEAVHRKATIVIEHLIQASDVAHTMQHWQIYRKWNARLFEEMYRAYLDGRAERDPSETWYEGEIGFFDYYIIPLAVKLRSCGVFGVSSDEYLGYAQQNRREWEAKGRGLVAEMVQSIQSQL